jgi:hypothetical protein
MQCRQCGKDLTGEDYRMVAEWPFCPECFQQLLEKPAEKDEADAKPDAVIEDVDAAEAEGSTEPRCQLCAKEIAGDQYKKVGIWIFCPECHMDMTPRPKPPPPPQSEEKPTEEEEAAARARFRVKYMHRVKCAQCGKMIPAGGSREVEAKPYCPDCYYELPEEVRQAIEDADAAGEAAPAELPGVEALPGCQSCGKQVAEEALQTVEGFAICRACLSSDAELAVHLARTRHQKRLQRLKDELEP